MKLTPKMVMTGLAVILITTLVLTVAVHELLGGISEREIENDMISHTNIARAEYYDEFKEIQQFSDLIVRRDVFLTQFKKKDKAALHTFLAFEMSQIDMDFVTLVDTNMTVVARANTNVSGDLAPFNKLVESIIRQDQHISSTEIASQSDLIKENLDMIIPVKADTGLKDTEYISSAMVQVHLEPVYLDERIEGVLITGRVLNNRNTVPNNIDTRLIYTTTAVYQGQYCVATSSLTGNNVLLGSSLPVDILKELYTGKISIGEIERFSTPYVYGAAPITDYNGNMIGALIVSSPKEPYSTASETVNKIIFYIMIVTMIVNTEIFYFASKRIISPLADLNNAARYVTAGKGYKKVDIETNDELGEMAESFNHMVDSIELRDEKTLESNEELRKLNESLQEQAIYLEAQQKQSAAYAEILTRLGSTIDLDTILREGLGNLMEYTNSPLGAVYLYDPDSKLLVPFVTNGAKKVVSEQEFDLDEGIPGQTAIKKEMIVVTDIPADSIYRIETGLCEIPPKTIVSTPMVFKDMLLGVIVTSHTGDVPRDVLDFMKRIVDQHAVAVNNAKTFLQSQKMTSTLKEQRDELNIKTQELAAASRTKSEFLANMSHELRTPLNSIIGFSEILHDETFGALNEKQSRYISNILTSGKNLLSLINDILDLSKVEAGKMELQYEEFNVSEAINEVTTITAPLAAKKKIVMETKIDPELTTILADKGKVKQILYNLISNATKFTPEKGHIIIDCLRAGDMAQIEVKDSGIGISKDDQKKLFRTFVQLDASTAREHGGTGLGLVLVKRFVEQHGGDVRLVSEPGKGSSFIFTIPIEGKIKAPGTTKESGARSGTEVTEIPEEPVLKETVDPEAETRTDKMPEVPPVKETLSEENIEHIEIPSIAEPEGATGNEPLILVVEDDKNASELLIITFTEAGYRAVPAYTGKEALAFAEKMELFAITLDIMLQGMDGWEVLNRLKNNPNTSQIPVIVISMVDNKEIGFAMGVVDYFIKPVEKSQLIASLDNLKKTLKVDALKVLVVDDEPNVVEMLSAMIEPDGYGVIRAYGGQEGIDKALSEHPDVLVLDLMMPVVSGFDVISTLKADPGTKDIPIIICTAKELKSHDIKVLSDNVVSIMRKGMFTADDILDEIKKITVFGGKK
jgi:signal transduction histidine kinase/CheY-like chemotaxis protein/HAMP domain-containing protein